MGSYPGGILELFVLFSHFIPEITFCVQLIIESRHEISNNVVCATSKGSDQPAHTHSLIKAYASRLKTLLLLSY